MAGNWMDDRERQMHERDRRRLDEAQRHGLEGRSWDREDSSRTYGARRSGADRDRVFGEGESGAGYGDRQADEAYRGRSSSRGWQDRHYGGVSPAMRQGAYGPRPQFSRQDYPPRGYQGEEYRGGGRFYGDDERERIYPQEYGQGGVEYGDVPSGFDAQRSFARERYQAEGYGRQGYDPAEFRHGLRRSAGGGAREDYEGGYGGRGGDFLHRAGERVASWFNAGAESGIHERDDFQGRGAFARGLGPQGYRRSDERISEDAHERLTDDTWLDASHISITVAAGELTLSGAVDNREAKHRAERLVEDISGVNHVQNNLRVAKGGFITGSGSGYGDSVLEAQMRRDDPASNGGGGAGASPSTTGKRN
jgi:hypothetical protein